jgi:uncharacterized protein
MHPPTEPSPARIADAPAGLVSWSVVPGKGRGVVATRACAAGTEVERAPVIVVPLSDMIQRPDDPTVFEQYLLYWSDEPGREVAMVGGLFMFYNHSTSPNVEFHGGPEPETMSAIALRDLAAGEELLYDYDCPLWFTPVE